MGVILDTCIWIDVERGMLTPAEVYARTGEQPVYVAAPILAELQYGVEQATNAHQRHRRASALARIQRKPCLLIDRDTGMVFGRLAAELERAGRTARHKVQDLWIAALAVQHNFHVLTSNEKDFAHIPALNLMVMPASKKRGETNI